MRLDDATDFRDVRVQCLGKEYHATAAAWQCLEEVRALRNERTRSNNPYDERAKSFNEVEQRYVNPDSRSHAVHTMLAGFGLAHDEADETPQQRLNRFKSDLHKQESVDSIRHAWKFLNHLLSF